jgi:hypothetical protein
MSPTVPPISTMATSARCATSTRRALISSVMCGITWIVAPRYSPRRSLVMTASYTLPVVKLFARVIRAEVKRS